MDFFAAQELRRKKTKWLVLMYLAAVAVTILGIYAVAELGFSAGLPAQSSGPSLQFHPWLLGVVALANLIVIGGASLYKIAELRSGGHHVAAQMGGIRVPPSTTDPDLKRLLNVVEEMALASGISVPPVYVMEHEPGINAFAAGYTPADAVIGVNRGTLNLLNRDELQGVIAHEYSHILNGDMRINIRLIGLLFGIQMIAMIGYFFLRSMGERGRYRRRSNNDGKGNGGFILAMAVALLVFGYIGQFFARLIKASISREREFLADASAVQFTRYPEGIGGALKVIAATKGGSVIHSDQAEELSHMFFASCFGSGFASMFATHPALPKRIVKLEPDFDGNYSAWFAIRQQIADQRERKRLAAKQEQAEKSSMVSPLSKLFPQAIVDRFPIDPIFLLSAIGNPLKTDMKRSQALIRQLPEDVRVAAQHPFSARCVAFAMLASDVPALRDQQLELLASRENQATVETTHRLLNSIGRLHLIFRLPVMELVQGSLADMSVQQYPKFRDTIERLVQLDRKTSLFEFVVRHHLLMHLDRRFSYRKQPRVKYKRASDVKQEIEMMLSAFASASVSGSVMETNTQPDDSVVLKAYRLGMQVAGFGDANESGAQLAAWEIEQLEKCMQTLHHASPQLKKTFLHAAAVLITYDHEITVAEAEFFRAVAESLDCPVPVLAAGRAKSATRAS